MSIVTDHGRVMDFLKEWQCSLGFRQHLQSDRVCTLMNTLLRHFVAMPRQNQYQGFVLLSCCYGAVLIALSGYLCV